MGCNNSREKQYEEPTKADLENFIYENECNINLQDVNFE